MRNGTTLSFGNTVLTTGSLMVDGRETKVLACVARLLQVLAYNSGAFVTLDRIYYNLYATRTRQPSVNTVKTLVCYARRDLKKAGSNATIEYSLDRGYKLCCAGEDTDMNFRFNRVQHAALVRIVGQAKETMPRLADLVASAIESPRSGNPGMDEAA